MLQTVDEKFGLFDQWRCGQVRTWRATSTSTDDLLHPAPALTVAHTFDDRGAASYQKKVELI
jgi:hypothetical protein